MAQHQPIRKTNQAAGSDIPDKLYFRIGEVAKLCDIPAYVLRFWESEFPQLKPHKGGTGQRLYRKRDVEMALRIRASSTTRGTPSRAPARSLKQSSSRKNLNSPSPSKALRRRLIPGRSENSRKISAISTLFFPNPPPHGPPSIPFAHSATHP